MFAQYTVDHFLSNFDTKMFAFMGNKDPKDENENLVGEIESVQISTEPLSPGTLKTSQIDH